MHGSEGFFAMCLFLQLCITFCVGNGNYPEVRDTCSSSVRDKQEVRQVRVMLKKGFILVKFILPSPHEPTPPLKHVHKCEHSIYLHDGFHNLNVSHNLPLIIIIFKFILFYHAGLPRWISGRLVKYQQLSAPKQLSVFSGAVRRQHFRTYGTQHSRPIVELFTTRWSELLSAWFMSHNAPQFTGRLIYVTIYFSSMATWLMSHNLP